MTDSRVLKHFSKKKTLLSSLRISTSLHFILIFSFIFSPSHFYKYLSLFSRFRSLAVPRGPLASRSLVFLMAALLFYYGIMHILNKVCSSPMEKGEPPARLPSSLRNKKHSFIFFHFLFHFLSLFLVLLFSRVLNILFFGLDCLTISY